MSTRKKSRKRKPNGQQQGWLVLTGFALAIGLIWAVRPAPPPKVVPHPVFRPVPRPSPVVPTPELVFPPGSGKIAIVLDDWGYSLRQVPALSQIRRPVTVAVLPSLLYSSRVAVAAHEAGHEVILHMPMEAIDPGVPREQETLLVGMSRAQVQATLSRALATVPHAKGVNNHQGSKATSNPVLMQKVLHELRRRDLFFLDSFVTSQSVCRQTARKTGIRFGRRDIFLDHQESPQEIQKQLMILARTANQKGFAIAIGHDRPATLDLLRKAVPALEKAGFRLVPLSELTQEEK